MTRNTLWDKKGAECLLGKRFIFAVGSPLCAPGTKQKRWESRSAWQHPAAPPLSETQPRDLTTRLFWSPASSVIAAQSLMMVWYPTNCPQLRGQQGSPLWIRELGDFRRHLTLASAPPLSEVWSPLSCDKDLPVGFCLACGLQLGATFQGHPTSLELDLGVLGLLTDASTTTL